MYPFQTRQIGTIVAALWLIACVGFLSMQQAACATSQVTKAKQVSVDVHAVLAAIDDAEMALCNKQLDNTCKSVVPQWTTEKHIEFSKHMVIALKAGRALNEGVRTVPVSSGAKVDLTTVSAELEILTGLVKSVLPPSSTVVIALTAAKDAILAILPLFLQ